MAEKSSVRILLISILLAAVIFTIDLFVPLGVAGGVPYVAIILVTLWLPGSTFTLAFACLCTLLTLAGFFLSPPGEPYWIVIPNRALAIFAIWAVAVLGLQRKKVERALQESEESIRSILENTADGIAVIDDGGLIDSFNPAAERLFGYDAKEVVARHTPELLFTFDTNGPEDWQARLTRFSERTMPVDLVGKRKDGSTFPAQMSISKISDDEHIRFIAVVRDVTERQQLEQELLRIGERERLAIGRELHEELGQSLTGLGLISKSLVRSTRSGLSADPDDLQQIVDQIQETDYLAKKLFRDLVPVENIQTGLQEALRNLAKSLEREYRIVTTLHAEEAAWVGDQIIAVHLYRIAEETIRSAVEDREAGRIDITIGRSDDSFFLRIEDDGADHHEIPPALPDRLILRANIIGARLTVQAVRKGRTVVTCTIPVGE